MTKNYSLFPTPSNLRFLLTFYLTFSVYGIFPVGGGNSRLGGVEKVEDSPFPLLKVSFLLTMLTHDWMEKCPLTTAIGGGRVEMIR